jgi:phosphoglycolate phosphatase
MLPHSVTGTPSPERICGCRVALRFLVLTLGSWFVSSGCRGEAEAKLEHLLPSATVLFDLDGTLVDTAPDLIDTLNLVLGREGLPAIDYDDARTLIGSGARRMIERGLAVAGHAVSAAELDRMYRDFIAHYADHIADRSRPFPGLDTALDELARLGCRFAVCTNKLEWLSVRLLDRLKLAGRFAAICGQDTFGVQKPNPEAVLGALRRVGGSRNCAVMVGDSGTDIAAARAARIPAIAVDFGYSEVPVERLEPDEIISHFNSLSGAVGRLLAAAGEKAAALAAAPISRY